MAYPAPGNTHGPGPPRPPHSNSTSSTETSGSTQHASPVDWSHYMTFGSSVSDQAGRPGTGGGGSNAGTGAAAPAAGQHDYHGFSQGMRGSVGAMVYSNPHAGQHLQQAPPPQQQAQAQRAQQQQHQQQQQQQHYPQPALQASQTTPRASAQRSPAVYAGQLASKGKAPAPAPPARAAVPVSSGGEYPGASSAADNGLSLDPSAFSRDIRFQVPPFLASHAAGAPAFPPGGEAWTGFSPAGFFGSMHQGESMFTPGGSLGYSQPFDGGFGGNAGESGVGQTNVLDGLSDFLGDSGTGLTPNYNPNAFFGNSHVSPAGPPAPVEPTNQTPQPPPQGQPSMMPPRDSGSSAPSSYGQPRAPQRQSTDAGAMPTASILGQQPGPRPFPTINIASSSTQPYAPPSNVDELLQQPTSLMNGPSLKDGPGLYSTTGFDMVGVLARVANRKDPKTILGPVDLSCSFVVVDIRKYDHPIVYASPTFTSLTGYDLPSLLNRNCRFLQSPDGDVVKGSKRKYTDNVAVAHLKRMLNAGKECQASLINYRRGGVPFINLVTVVPIPWDGTDIVYHVGFQVDLVEQPNAILRNMRDGSYQVNYTVANPPQTPLRLPSRPNVGASGLSQEQLDILGLKVNAPGFAQGEDGGKLEWLKMVLENADDFIHVLSLKGQFQYVSPSVRRVLEYEPEDLLNKNVSDFCHPSDIVPLMRELKDSTHAPNEGQAARTVNLLFRIRRKNSGYVWIESLGRLHVEPGKGRKAVILSGRARTVPILPWDAISSNGGLADVEFWTKVSFQGLILHATSSVQTVLGQPVDDVIGHSFYSLLPGGEDGAPTAAQLAADPTCPASVMALAVRQATAGGAGRGGVDGMGERDGDGNGASGAGGTVALKHDMLTRDGKQVAVTSVIYAAHNSSAVLHPIKDGDSDDDSATSRQTSVSTTSISGAKPCYLVIQTKVDSSASPSAAPDTTAAVADTRPVVHPLSANLFEELETTRGTSWQYELHQLRLLNRRLKEDIGNARKGGLAAAAAGGAARKRARRPDGAPAGQAPLAAAVPEQFQAAPRHQLAPGFGLVAPGMPSPYY